jgi:hypothetical protein
MLAAVDQQPWAQAIREMPGPLQVGSGAEQVAIYTRGQAEEAEGEVDGRLRGRGLLWAFLLHLLENGGSLEPATGFFPSLDRDAAAEHPFGGLAGGSAGVPAALLQNSSASAAHATPVVARVQNLLLAGRSREACEHAMQHDLWDLAIMLAATMDQELWPVVTLRWARRRFTLGGPISVLMHVMTGHQAHVLEEGDADAAGDMPASEMEMATATAVGHWRENLRMLLVSQATGDEGCEAIAKLGDALHADGQLYSAHLCWVISGIADVDPAKIPLVGAVMTAAMTAAGGRLPRAGLLEVAALQLTELYEYTRGLADGTGGDAAPMRGFQPLKMLYAQQCVELGLLKRGREYAAQLYRAVLEGAVGGYRPGFALQVMLQCEPLPYSTAAPWRVNVHRCRTGGGVPWPSGTRLAQGAGRIRRTRYPTEGWPR